GLLVRFAQPAGLRARLGSCQPVQKNVEHRLSSRSQAVALSAQYPVSSHLIQRPEQYFRYYLCVQLRTKHATLLSVFDYAANHIEILGDLSGRELFHELS